MPWHGAAGVYGLAVDHRLVDAASVRKVLYIWPNTHTHTPTYFDKHTHQTNNIHNRQFFLAAECSCVAQSEDTQEVIIMCVNSMQSPQRNFAVFTVEIVLNPCRFFGVSPAIRPTLSFVSDGQPIANTICTHQVCALVLYLVLTYFRWKDSRYENDLKREKR